MITAKVGTLKRKQQMREFLEHLPKDNHDDVFTATPLQNRRVQVNLGQQLLWDCSPAGCARGLLQFHLYSPGHLWEEASFLHVL